MLVLVTIAGALFAAPASASTPQARTDALVAPTDRFLPGPCTGSLCPPSFPPVNNNAPAGRDESVNVFVGGDLNVSGAVAEMEGRVVALGSVDVDKSNGGTYNVGIAGVGSRVFPPAGSDFLTVGGDLRVANRTRLDAFGGAVRVAGASRGRVAGTVVSDPEAGATYSDAREVLATQSQCLATHAPTGTVSVSGWEAVFDGDGHSPLQVFSVDEWIQGREGAPTNVRFTNIPDTATVLITLRGEDVRFTSYAGDLTDSSDWNALRERLLWNIPDAQTVSLRGGMQFQGSVIIGRSDSVATVSAPGVAGRFFTAGTLHHTSDALSGQGAEFHAYPFTGVMPKCKDPIPPKAELTLVKHVAGGERSSADWNLVATPHPNTQNIDLAHTVPGSETGTTIEVTPGVTYALSETGPTDGYDLESLRCDAGAGTTAHDATEVTVAAGERRTCVFVNVPSGTTKSPAPPPPTAMLTLVKLVDNAHAPHGLPATAWELQAESTSTSIAGVTGTPGTTRVSVPAGTYQLTETGPGGYRPSDWVCVGATTATAHAVTLSDGDTATCTLTNTIVETPTRPESATPSASPPAGLAATGSPRPEILIASALAAILLGLTVLLVHKRARSRR